MAKIADDIKSSKFLSRVLRHEPDIIGITLDKNGWANVRELIKAMCETGRKIDKQTLERIVVENDKQRFSFNDSHTKIKANQGHSINVELELTPCNPPNVLYHGTALKFLDSISKNGITKQKRQYVHLSSDVQTAFNVGKRHGTAVILPIDTIKMQEDNHIFYLSENNVWLCDNIDWQYVIKEEILYNLNEI